MSKPKDIVRTSEPEKKKALTETQLDEASGAGVPVLKPPEQQFLETLAAERNKR